MSSLVSQENKELLWSLLSEEGLFDGIPENVTPEEIKHVFERILKNLSATIPSLHAAKLKELHHAKQYAITEEDYDAAKKLRATIDEMEAPLARLEKLESRKHLAIQAEDFEAAKQIKMEIDRIRAASFSLKELNKIAIESLAVNIPKLARDISALKTQGTAPPSRGGFPHNNSNTKAHQANQANQAHQAHQAHGYDATPKEIYNAEDFQYQKRQEVEMKMREKEAEMRSYFEIPRPPEIDFSDIPREQQQQQQQQQQIRIKSHQQTPTAEVVYFQNGDDNGDSPLANGDDMERLIAERITARQRDMDEIGERMKASMPPEHTRTPVKPIEYNPNITEDTRKVRFQEDTNPIFLKLKRKPMLENDEGS